MAASPPIFSVAAGGMDRETILAERGAVLGHARAFARAIDTMVARGGDAAEGQSEAGAIRRAILNFANDVAIGLHRDGPEDPDVRTAMAALIKQMEAGNG